MTVHTRKPHLRLIAALMACAMGSAEAATTILNVSYDVTREFYKEYNPAFAEHWKKKRGEAVTIKQSHGGSSKQARAVLDGLEADVVTMNQATDVDVLAKSGLVPADWAARLPHNASPFTSTIVFVVRKGNPKGIREWEDLVRPGIEVVIPNPKTSGNGRYSYLAAWGYAAKQGEAASREFVTKLFRNVPVLDAGGRGATTTFAQRGIGDVLLTFENEAHLSVKELKAGEIEIVVPSVSILAEAPVALVEKVAAKRGTQELATAYLEYLYSPEGQALAAKHFLRPRSAEELAKHQAVFPKIELFTIEEIAGGWGKAQATHFDDGGVFDQIYLK